MQKKIGILGFGVVGKSALSFLQNKKNLDLKHLAADLEAAKIDVWDQGSSLSMNDFIDLHDLIIPSPGINLNDFYSVREKFICELDIFSAYFKKPVVAITGSLGKTTITKIFGILLAKSGFNPFVGGNIGLGMLEAIGKQDSYDIGVLELSSFQLEFSKYFAPDLALFTNCFPNHLDRHKTLKEYFDAKFNLFKYQTAEQFALFPWQILQGEVGALFAEQVNTLKSNICFVSDSLEAQDFPASVLSNCHPELVSGSIVKPYKIFYRQDNNLMFSCHPELGSGSNTIFDLSVLPEVTFIQNWIMIIAGLYLLGADLEELQRFFIENSFVVDDHHHRVEHFATINGVSFYDDSKATVIQSTLAAVKRLACKGRVILILGGLNKGVDRSPIISELAQVKELKKVYCYGPNCSDFGSFSCNLNSLEDIISDITKITQPGDQVLFSPSGTSFDFYQNYKHRGGVFKELILKLKN
jgi:UDP-N-acetylmuramoylalanine--D-glutamate ligase